MADAVESVKPLPEDFECGVCLQLLKEPMLTGCCGHHFCRACIDLVLARNHVCPLCKEDGFEAFRDKKTEREIYNLEVYCSKKFCGCQWIGELRNLDRHLDVKEGQCEFVEVGCDFAPIGCPVRQLRGDLARHLEENKERHMLLMSAACMRSNGQLQKMEERFQQQLSLQDQRITEMKAEKDREVRELHEELAQKDEKIAQVETEVQRLKTELKRQEKRILTLERMAHDCPPFAEFTLHDFSKLKASQMGWFGPGFYTHPGGYKLCIKVYPNSQKLGEGNHVSLYFYIMRGAYDKQLKWPKTIRISIQLLNQLTGEWEHQHAWSNLWRRPSAAYEGGGYGWPKFIAHTDLDDPGRNIQYLKNDCLQFRISGVGLDP